MSRTILWAHAPLNGGTWHPLARHLARTARLCVGCLPKGVDPRWGRALGFVHDVGKVPQDWQDYLRHVGEKANREHDENSPEASEEQKPENGKRKGPAHAPLGAILAMRRWGAAARPVVAVIAGHHGGLKDRIDLDRMLDHAPHQPRVDVALAGAYEWFRRPWPLPPLPAWIHGPLPEKSRRLDLWTRMLFSALVDADFLDTEHYFATEGGSKEAAQRLKVRQTGSGPTIELLLEAFERGLGRFGGTPVGINALRTKIRSACERAGLLPPGMFSLTVPTGGGKTLAALAFALHHAKTFGLKRVIVAVPFTSVVEQTADVYRTWFRDYISHEVVLEHHSNLDPGEETPLGRVAAENWDMPIVVTTQVQLFESLFGSRPATCRKVHNLCDSVLVLDEVQSLPPMFLRPILDVLQDLSQNYGTTLLLTTATQPALESRRLDGSSFQGFQSPPREIIPAALMEALWPGSEAPCLFERVRVHWPEDWNPLDPALNEAFWPALATRIQDAKQRQVLVIVHRRQDAQDLWRALHDLGLEPLHLSATMCPRHRRAVLAKIRLRLKHGRPCIVVSTQLVEAGVDISFPTVYRAMAGLEALAQSAGRCNRHGELKDRLGDFFVFNAPSHSDPPQGLRLGLATALNMKACGPDAVNLFRPTTFHNYFSALYAKRDLDSKGIQECREHGRFSETAQRFRMIEDAGETVLVGWGPKGKALVERFLEYPFGPSRELLRQLQPYTVSISRSRRKRMEQDHVIREAHGLWVLQSDPHYDSMLGLLASEVPFGSLMC